MLHVLVTGFDSFGGQSVNPSAALASAVDGQEIAGGIVRGRQLPVSFRDIGGRLDAVIAEVDPVAIICLGVFPGEPVIRLERLAANFADFGIADNDGMVAHGPVMTNGPDAIRATWPVRDIQQRLLASGIPARISDTAGSFLCNATLYRALAAFSHRVVPPPVGFLHVPYLPEQVSAIIAQTASEARMELHQRADLASMAFETQLAALHIAIETTLAAVGGGNVT